MSRQFLFIQGGGAGTHDIWDNKLVHSLETALGPAYAVRYPRMPDEGEPNYSAWRDALYALFDELDGDAILVGHSIGASFLIHALAERRVKQSGVPFYSSRRPSSAPAGGRATKRTQCQASQVFRQMSPCSSTMVRRTARSRSNTCTFTRKAVPHATTRLLADRDHQLNNDLSEVARDIRELQS